MNKDSVGLLIVLFGVFGNIIAKIIAKKTGYKSDIDDLIMIILCIFGYYLILFP